MAVDNSRYLHSCGSLHLFAIASSCLNVVAIALFGLRKATVFFCEAHACTTERQEGLFFLRTIALTWFYWLKKRRARIYVLRRAQDQTAENDSSVSQIRPSLPQHWNSPTHIWGLTKKLKKKTVQNVLLISLTFRRKLKWAGKMCHSYAKRRGLTIEYRLLLSPVGRPIASDFCAARHEENSQYFRMTSIYWSGLQSQPQNWFQTKARCD